MKYITSVQDNGSKKHIVEVSGKNREVVEANLGGYGDKKDEMAYHFENVSTLKSDFTFKLRCGYENMHLADVVLCIEIAKFIKSQEVASNE